MPSKKQSRAVGRGKASPWPKLPHTRASSAVPNENRTVVPALPDVRGPRIMDQNVTMSVAGPIVKIKGTDASASGVTPLKAPPVYRLSILGQTTGHALAEALESSVFMELVDLIRQRHGVLIERSRVLPGSLAVCGPSLVAIHAAHTSICDLLHHKLQLGLHEAFMVQPVDGRDRKAVLTENDTINPGWARFSFADSPLDASQKLKKEEIRSLLHAQAVVFGGYLDAAAPNLKVSPTTLHMRLQLGRVLLRTKNDRSVQPSCLKAFFSRSPVEGDIVFDHRIDDKNRFHLFRKDILDSRGHFYPCSSTIMDLNHVQPQRFLVVVTEAFRAELEIGAPRSAPDGRSAKLSQLRLFQLRGVEGRVEITTSCPSHCLDWRLIIVPELTNVEAPQSIKSILSSLAVVYPEEETDFPNVIVQPGLIQTHKIKQLFGRTTWSVGCKGTRYTMELEMQHRFPNLELAGTPLVSTSMSLWNASWGDALKEKPAADSVRDFGTNWDKLFVPTGHGDGVVDFLKMVRWALRFVDSSFARHKAEEPSASSTTKDPNATGPAEPTKLADRSCPPVSNMQTKENMVNAITTAAAAPMSSEPEKLAENIDPTELLFALDFESAPRVQDVSTIGDAEEDLIIFD